MNKKLYILSFLLALSLGMKAQQYYPFSFNYASGERVHHNGAAQDSFSVSYSGGTPFGTTWKSALPDGTNYALSGMRHNILFLDNAFSEDLFASKGYYGDYVELKWDLDRYANQVSNFRIYRKKIGSTADSTQVANLSADARTWRDEYAESGVMYHYYLFAEGIFPVYQKFMNYIDAVGFRVPYARISGRVTYAGGAAVPDVGITAETEDNFSGSSIYLNGTNAYLAISPKADDPLFKLDTAMTFQGWFRSDGNNGTLPLFEKQGQYKLTHTNGSVTFTAGTQNLTLNFTEKVDTFFHVTAMRTANKLKLFVIYKDDVSYKTEAAFSGSTTANNNELYIGKSGADYFKGWVDEIKIWHKSFSDEEIIRYAGTYFAGTEANLSAYYRLNEGIGDQFYDLSRQGFTFNENHGYKHSTAQWSTVIPYSRQLAVKGITDNNGNYIIAGIPYATDGSVYRFVPRFGDHSFDPTEQLLFLGPGATSHSNIDFIDVASFPVTGEVFYKGTFFPVEGVSIKIDGKPAVTAEGKAITTDSKGKFTVDVPIGQHYIQLDKYGHGFENNGRFPENLGEFFDFQSPYTFQTRFQDTTRIKVIGKVVGGPVQAEKPKGLGKSTNNIGNATIVFGTEKGYDLAQDDTTGTWQNMMYENADIKDRGDTKFSILGTSPKQITINPDINTGEFFLYLLPEKYNIKSVVTSNYTFGDEFHTTLDLSSAYMFRNESDSVKIEPPIITPIGDTIYNYRIDSVGYQTNLDLIYRVSPSLTVTSKDGDNAFWEKSVMAKDDVSISITETDGTPKTQHPIFLQRKKYDLKVSVFEQYEDEAGTYDNVPVTDGNVEIQNSMATDDARKLYQISSLGIVNYSFNAGLPSVVGDYTKSLSIIAYTGNGGTISTPWEYTQAGTYPYTGPFKGYVFGGLPSGNNFITTGPSQIDMIVRDPYGTDSYAYYETSNSVTETSSYSVDNQFLQSMDISVQMGAKVKTFVGLGAGTIIETEVKSEEKYGFEFSTTWLSNNTTSTTITNTQRWETSAEHDFFGANADLYIGHSTNIIYGISNFLDLIPTADCDGTCENATTGYKIGIHKGLRVSPEFGTAFQYSQNHIINYLIPNLKMLRNLYLKNSSFYTVSNGAAYGDDNYATPNTTLTENHQISVGDTVLNYTGDSYSYQLKIGTPYTTADNYWAATDKQFVDSVKFYNEQIKNWERVLARNEKEKLEAKLVDNYSFDAGVVFESSRTIETSELNTSSFEFNISPSVAKSGGVEAMGIGLSASLSRTYSHTETEEDGTETVSSSTFGYVLADSDVGDYYSIDIKEPKTNTGPVFSVRGGQSSCPYVDSELTQYYQPNTSLSQATMQRENPLIVCDEPVLTDVPADQPAIFTIQLQNASVTNDASWFMVSVDEQTNQSGANIKLDGNPIGNGRIIYIPGNTVINKTLTIEKVDPAVNNFDDIGIILSSSCQFDPTDNIPEISDTISVSARFKPVCSGVELTNPDDLWVINTNTGTDLTVNLDNYNLAHTGFEKIIFQYKPTSTSQWIGDMVYYVDQTQFDAASDPKTYINGSSSLQYTWDMSSLQDRQYNIRAITTCANGTTNESVTLTGIKDTKRPQIFGTPQPGDGILSPGDDVMLTFDETIEAGLLLSSNFSVRGVLNGAQIRHNSALYFDGIDDYAGVISGVNLQDKSFTVEFWTKRADLTPGVIFDQGQIQMGFNSSNQFYVTLGNQTSATGHTFSFTDKWIHIAATFDYDTKQLAVYSAYDGHNAIELENVNITSDFNGNGRMYIGKNQGETKYFNGFIHDFRIWEKFRGYASTNAQMLVSMNGEEIGLGGMWPMDEAQGYYAQDLSRSHHAMLVGAQWRVFPTGYARTFNGTSDYLTIPTASSIIITDEMDMTLELYFRGGVQTNTVLFSNGKADGSESADALEDIWIIGVNNKGEIYAKNNEISITALEQDYLDNEWHHLAVVLKRNANTSLYIDGQLKAYQHSSNFGGLKGAKMTMGASQHYTNGTPYTNFFNGSIDEFRAWKLARTAKLLNMDLSAKLSGDEKGLVAYYPFDKYDVNLILQPVLVDCDINDNTGALTGLSATENGGAFDNTNVPNLKDARPIQNLAFNWVVNDDKIIINIEEPADLVEKCVIEFTVDRVEDMRENRMASPVTWTAYIKKNTVIWNDSELNFEKKRYEPLSFDVDILNIGGVEQNYTISNLPVWLSISEPTGTLAPDSKKTVTFNVSESTNIGNYDVSIYLTSDFGYDEKLELRLKVYETPPQWEVVAENYQYSMSVIGQVKIDGIFSINPDDKVAAFVGDECRGVANLQYIEDYDIFEVFLNISSNTTQGDEVTFKIWNATEGIVHENVTPELIFESNTFRGTPSAPQILETTNSYVRELPLVNGWKWVSFNLNDKYLDEINNLFKYVNASAGDQIKGQIVFDNFGTSSGWSGSLSNSNGLKPDQMYMVKLSAADTLKISGAKFAPLTTNITLIEGWSWIGFTPQVNIDINDALSNFNPNSGDIIKSQYYFAMYDPAMGWIGSLTYLIPGQGYMYKNTTAVQKLFVYPEAGLSKKTFKAAEPITVEGWKLDAEKYQYSMSIVAELNIQATENMYIGAFVGDECRGLARVTEAGSKSLYFITIYSNSYEETVRFELFNNFSNIKTDIVENISFLTNGIEGTIETPKPLTVKGTSTEISESEFTKISIYPNPVSETLYVQFSANNYSDLATFELTDVAGKKVKSGILNIASNKKAEIDVQHLATGVYFLKLENSNVSHSEKIMIK